MEKTDGLKNGCLRLSLFMLASNGLRRKFEEVGVEALEGGLPERWGARLPDMRRPLDPVAKALAAKR